MSIGGSPSPVKRQSHFDGDRRPINRDLEMLREDAKVEFKNVYIKKLRERYRSTEAED